DLISFALASLPESESKTKIERYLKQFILPGVEGVENLIRKWRHLRDGRLHTPVPTDLARLVLRAVALVADPCQQRHVTIRVCGQLCGEKVKSYPGEENGLKGMVNAEQIVIGLSYVIRNALEAVQEQKEGRVQIDLDQESPGTHVILIDDNGAGIPEENRELVWRSFFSTKGQDRNGLGLPLAKQVIEKCQSQIECAPSPLGGTAFRILVPACPSKAV
ncbi:hypothetical protein HQ520_00820, partial [bacterium]|nr:hypothetical protein [bacterium]